MSNVSNKYYNNEERRGSRKRSVSDKKLKRSRKLQIAGKNRLRTMRERDFII